jgi:hypothetical protein
MTLQVDVFLNLPWRSRLTRDLGFMGELDLQPIDCQPKEGLVVQKTAPSRGIVILLSALAISHICLPCGLS